ncbi:hypothetical protein [Vreelandella titanicae]|uniref:hypothetical protein n=1 Tax=Vreelandella titanicae TaxID=664683 RepID=UPI0011407C8D|nr:hypothetical protein [Halomonas titanicae]
MEDAIGSSGLLGIPIIIELSTPSGEGGLAKGFWGILTGALLASIFGVLTAYINEYLKVRRLQKTVRTEIKDIYDWAETAVVDYAKCLKGVSYVMQAIRANKEYSDFYLSSPRPIRLLAVKDNASVFLHDNDSRRRHWTRVLISKMDDIEVSVNKLNACSLYKGESRKLEDFETAIRIYEKLAIQAALIRWNADLIIRKEYILLKRYNTTDEESQIKQEILANTEKSLGIELPREEE